VTNFSPNVVAREFDFSDYAIRSSTTILACLGYATKGPTHSPVLITNERELIDTFGPAQYEQVGQDLVSKNLITPAIQYLRQGNQLYVIRVNSNATTASVTLSDTGGPAAAILTLTAISPGSWTTTQGLSVRISSGSAGTGYYKMELLVGGVVREKYDNLTTLNSDQTNWASARVNQSSFLVRVTEQGALNGTVPANISATPLTGGTDGSGPSVSDFTSVGKGLDLLKDPDLLAFNLLITPGAIRECSDTTQVITRAALALCEGRGDAFYIADVHYDLDTVAELKDSVNGTGAYGSAIDSSYGGFWAPWLAVYDSYNQKTVWCPPSAFVAGQMAYNDRVAQAWYAPAGLNRGKIQIASGVRFNLNRDELEVLQAPREIINPIRNMVGEGIVIWGQRTAQRKTSALDRVNVRRMINFAKSSVIGATRILIFDQNDSKTWRKFTQLVQPIIQNIKDTRGLYDFRVICDESTNPPTLIDQNQMQGKILLKPTKTAEVITVDFNILNTGASFNEFI